MAMKKLIFLINLIVIPAMVAAQENSLFFLKDDNTSTYLLEIDTVKNCYVYSKHNSKRIHIDKGEIIKKGKQLIFKSQVQYNSFNPLLKVKTFFKYKKLYYSKKDMLFNKNPRLNIEVIDVYVDYKLNQFDEFASNKRIVISTNSESMEKYKGNEFKERFLEILKLRLPVYYDVVSENYIGPDEYEMYIDDKRVEWDKDVSGYAIMDMFSTIVHESVHGTNGVGKILLYPDSLYDVYRTSVVPTKTMTAYFEKKCTTAKIFRFGAYIKDAEDNLSSNISGIYGLLNEFCAYYHDVQSSYLMYNVYNELGSDFNYFKDEMANDALETYYAYYEFNLFIGGYLSYLKEYNKDVYYETIANKSLCIAYTEINRQFADVVDKVENEFNHYESYQYFLDKYVDSTKNSLQQFLPELENIKSNITAKN